MDASLESIEAIELRLFFAGTSAPLPPPVLPNVAICPPSCSASARDWPKTTAADISSACKQKFASKQIDEEWVYSII